MGIGDLKLRSGLRSNQEDFIAVYHFGGGTIQNVNRARAISESPQSSTSAGTRGFGDGPLLAFEGLALVLGTCHVNDTSGLVARPWTHGVPDDIDVALRISRDRASAVQPIKLVKI